MKKAAFLLMFVAFGWLVWRAYRSPESPPSGGTPERMTWKGAPPGFMETDPVKVFQRAFWVRPSADDHILHAVRHEWREGGQLSKWQWFVVVKPSEALRQRLLEENTFGLVRGGTAALPEEAPPWFTLPSGESIVMKPAQGNLQFVFSKAGDTLFACDSGAGFRPGAPEPAAKQAP